jgi:alpha-galactosidase
MSTNRKHLVLIGAGSVKFTLGLVQDLIADGGEWELRLVDVNPQSLEIAGLLAQRLVEAHDAPITVRQSEERRDLLAGAEVVVSTIGVGSRPAWEQDVFVSRQFGIYYPVGDTYGPPGISRALRMVPPMIDIADDVATLCPKALFINYANPMSVVCRAIRRATSAKVVGLCIGVKGIHDRLSRLIEASPDDVWSAAIGVNHLTWFTELRYQGRNAWPLLKEKMAQRPDGPPRESIVWDLFEIFGAYPAVGDGHVVEFFPGWHGKGGYYGHTLGTDHHRFESIIERDEQIFQLMKDRAYGRVPVIEEDKDEVGEYSQLTEILRAVFNDIPGYYSVNLPNTGQAGNLPRGAVLEATTLVNGSGFHPLSFGELPPGITAILQRVIGVQELTVEAALKGDRQLVVQALLADGEVLTQQQAEALTDALLNAQRQWLPQFFD